MYRVFLAEDEPWVLIALKSLIDWQREGFVICGEAGDGLNAWKRIERLKPDFILSDIRMPGEDGIALIKRIRNSGMESEVAFISGYTDFEYARAGIQYGCVDYLIKPVDEEALRACLKKVKEKLLIKYGEQSEEKEEGYLSEHAIVSQILELLAERYKEKLSLSQIAAKFQMSESYISNLIRKETGKNYKDHLLELRIQKAQELLKNTNYSIEKIAEEVGYKDYFYFTKVYKEATGITPAVYRKQL